MFHVLIYTQHVICLGRVILSNINKKIFQLDLKLDLSLTFEMEYFFSDQITTIS